MLRRFDRGQFETHVMDDESQGDADQVDAVLSRWASERPDINATPLAVSARILLLSRILSDRCDVALGALGLTLWQYDVLAALRRAGSPFQLSPTELARAVTLSTAAMTNRLDRLEAKGWIQRKDAPSDRRSLLIQLTESGRELIDRALPIRVESDRRTLRALPPESQVELSTLLRRALLASRGT